MPIVAVFTKEEQTELKKMKKLEKDGKVINWESYLAKRSLKGQERWNSQRKPRLLKQAEKTVNKTKKEKKKRRKKSATK